jgi:FkbM family methyltransferase
MILKILKKLKRDGVTNTLHTTLKVINYRAFQPDWDFKLIPDLMEKLKNEGDSLTIVQIGANVGDTGSDQIYDFLKKTCADHPGDAPVTCRAVLVEPVRHLFNQLRDNYRNFLGVSCENVAIADRACTRNFYRLREGIDLEGNGLQPFAEELGSFLPEHLNALWNHDPGNHRLREFVEANTVVDEVSCLSMDDLVAKHHLQRIDLLQVDTEGYDYEILRTIDFKKLSPAYINYERIHLKKDEAACRELLTRHGYKLHDHGQDTLATRTSGLTIGEKLREAVYCAWLKLVY